MFSSKRCASGETTHGAAVLPTFFRAQRWLTLPWGMSTRSELKYHQSRTLSQQIGTALPVRDTKSHRERNDTEYQQSTDIDRKNEPSAHLQICEVFVLTARQMKGLKCVIGEMKVL